MLDSSTFQSTSGDDALFETYRNISHELYGSGRIHATGTCLLLRPFIALLEILDNSPPQHPIVLESWLLCLPACAEHQPCVFCSGPVTGSPTSCLNSLRAKVIQSALSLILSVHNIIRSSEGFIPPLIASSRAFTAGCALVLGTSKGWVGSTDCQSAFLQCSEILSFAAPLWKGGQQYLDVWRTIATVI